MNEGLTKFLACIRSLFRDEDQASIDLNTDLKKLEEWSSLQVMIIVTEIDMQYNVVLNVEDIRNADSILKLYQVVQAKLM